MCAYYTAEQKMEILNYAKEKGEVEAAKKYLCTQGTIQRWSQNFNGTAESLTDNRVPPRALNPHTPEEVEIIKKILRENPYMPYADLHKKLKQEYDYNKPLSGMYEFLRAEGITTKLKSKNELPTMFDSESITCLNEKYLFNNKNDLPQYLVEVDNGGIYVGKPDYSSPCKFTVYYSVALKFPDEKHALNFINSLNNTTPHTLTVKRIDCPEICKSLLD